VNQLITTAAANVDSNLKPDFQTSPQMNLNSKAEPNALFRDLDR
jgi:hypothetical protein